MHTYFILCCRRQSKFACVLVYLQKERDDEEETVVEGDDEAEEETPEEVDTKSQHLYFAPSRGVKYCNEHVCVSVCLFVCPLVYVNKNQLLLTTHVTRCITANVQGTLSVINLRLS